MAIDFTKQTALNLQAQLKVGFWSGESPPENFYDAVNFTELSITTPVQEDERLKSNMEGTVGQDLSVVPVPVEDSGAQLTAQFNRAPIRVMALAIGADVTELSQTGGTPAVDEAITLAAGLWVPLGSTYLASFEGLKDAGDAAIDPAEYEVDLMDGMIMAKTAAGALGTKASYTPATMEGAVYEAGKVKSPYIMLRGTTTNKVNDARGTITIHRVSVAPSGAWDMVSGGFWSGGIAGSCITPVFAGYTKPSPYAYVETDILAA